MLIIWSELLIFGSIRTNHVWINAWLRCRLKPKFEHTQTRARNANRTQRWITQCFCQSRKIEAFNCIWFGNQITTDNTRKWQLTWTERKRQPKKYEAKQKQHDLWLDFFFICMVFAFLRFVAAVQLYILAV